MISTKSANTIKKNTIQKAPKIALCTLLLSSALSVSACQDANDTDSEVNNSEANNMTTTSSTDTSSAEASTTSITNDTQPTASYDSQPADVIDVDSTDELNITTDDDTSIDSNQQSETGINNNNDSTTGNAPLSEIQVTDVEYQDSQGRSIYVTFKTSATSTLQADLRLPSGKRVLLTAPTGQGNNPTYHSTDGSIELVTHGGGASIDLFYKNQRSKFDAVKTDAEILQPQ